MIKFKKLVEVIAGKSYLKSFNHSLKEGFKWSVNGFWLFYLNIKCSNSLLHKRILGNDLNFNEKKLIRTTVKDTMKIIPFSFFIVIPFAEFGLPFAIKLFPSMLPSTFTFKSVQEIGSNLFEKKKVELLEFNSLFQNIMLNLKKSENFSISLGINNLEKIQRQLLESKEFDQAKLYEIISGPIKHMFELENLNIETLRSISRVMDISTMGNKFLLMLRIRYKILKLKSEDKDILWDGIDQISKQNLQKVLISRLIDHKVEYGTDKYKELLMDWIKMSSIKQLPLSIILWIQITKLIGEHANKLQTF